MDIFRVRDRLIEDYREFTGSFVDIHDKTIREHVAERMANGYQWPDPWLSLNPSFASGGTVSELIQAGLLQPGAKDIFRLPNGQELRLHKHQKEAIEAARTGKSYVLTTGTGSGSGSGKSLAYIVPIVDKVLEAKATGTYRPGIKAIVVYPMNALANSQLGELEKFLGTSSPQVTFERYTGQESQDKRASIIASPPDILLTNYVMLELVLTRPRERGLVKAAKGLCFLVLDELHTYHGRQGADVALLVRRLRDACDAPGVQCIGTSATIITEGGAGDQRKEVARTAETLFGVPVDPVNVIGETLQRITGPAAISATALRGRVEDPVPPGDFGAFTTDPLATWIEEVFGFEPGSPADSPRRRRRPPTLPEAARQLAVQTDSDEQACATAIKQTLQAGARIINPSTGRPVFAFRLHQFLSKGDNVYVTLEPPARRHVTSTYQVAAPATETDGPDRILVPTAFCRECGQEYLAVTRTSSDGTTRYAPRRDNDAADGNDKSGYLFISDDQPWPLTQQEALTDGRLPYSWVTYDPATGGLVIDPAKAGHLPEPVYVDVTGRETDATRGSYAAYLPSPFRFCLRCRTSYEQARGSDFAKLAKLSAEGRSSAMSLVTASVVRTLRATADLDARARKLLAFVDNRQDASLQAGHFGDFVQVTQLRGALCRALTRADGGLTDEIVARMVTEELGLAMADFAQKPDAKYSQKDEALRALREVTGYRLYLDLERGWRVIMPNLEQTGLLRIAYRDLPEVAHDEEAWDGCYSALREDEPDHREEIAAALLDELRRNLAIDVEYLTEDGFDLVRRTVPLAGQARRGAPRLPARPAADGAAARHRADADLRRRGHRQDRRGGPDRRGTPGAGRCGRGGGAVRSGTGRTVAAGAAGEVRHSRGAGVAVDDPPTRAGPAARRDAIRPVPEHRGLHRLHQAPRAAGAVLARLPGPTDRRRGAHLRVRRHRRPVTDAAARARHGAGREPEPAPGPGHGHPAQRQGGGLPQPPRPARAEPVAREPGDGRGPGPAGGYFVQRRRRDIRKYLDESTPFPEDRRTAERTYALPGEYKELFDDVLTYARETVRDPEGGALRQWVRYWSALALLRALASSPRAAAATLTTRADNLDASDTAEADRLGRSAVLDLPDEETVESADATPGADADTSDGDTPHRRRLRRFAARARQLEGAGDKKLRLIEQTAKELLLDGFNPVIFCRFIDTAEYVAEHLSRRLGNGYAVAAVTGTLPPDERVARIAELTADENKRPVPVATDCLSEGVNLQEHFQAVVHYDLAWNPTRHEQREGRVDRFGQRYREVRAVTIYGADNGIDGIVLDVLLRKHEQIRRALGISVPVPDRSDDVVEAILEGLLLHEAASEQLTLDIGLERREELHREWDSAAEKEKLSRTKYAQSGIQPGEVARELEEIRASLGTASDVRGFAEEALRADVVPVPDGFTALTGPLPDGLRDALVPGHAEPLPFRMDLPVKPREAYLDRTDPNVAAIARYVLESALDSVAQADSRDRPARRCGVMRTSAVPRRTTLLLVRFRMHLELPGRDGPRQLAAEDAQVLAYRGRPAAAEWLSPPEVSDLLAAAPTSNVPPDQARDFAERAVASVPALLPHLSGVADDLATKLRDDHIRVREAGAQRGIRRQVTVRAQKPADVLGVYVYLPGGAA